MKKYLILIFLLFLIKCNTNPGLWSNGRIPYCYASSSFTVNEKAIIEDAMASWEESYVIKFYEEPCDTGVVHLQKGSSNYSTFGSQSFSFIVLRDFQYDVIAHELGHTIGLMHEHQRPDRDNYIYVLYENIISAKRDQFDKLNDDYFLYNYKKYAYDYSSIMHYDKYAFTANGLETIESPVPISNYAITKTDYAKVKYMYNPENLGD